MRRPMSDDRATAGAADGQCPLCGAPLYGWILLPPDGGAASVGMALDSGAAEHERVIVRCEECGVALDRNREVDFGAEWEAIAGSASADVVAAPNRASLQAAIGVEGWAGIGTGAGALLLTPRSLELLATRTGARLGRVRTPVTGRAQAWMWQTLLNGLTFHPNFAREVRAGHLRPANARSRWAFALDTVVTILAAPLVLLVSVPLELGAAVLRRGGEMRGDLERS
jgi:hypothetical protein